METPMVANFYRFLRSYDEPTSVSANNTKHIGRCEKFGEFLIFTQPYNLAFFPFNALCSPPTCIPLDSFRLGCSHKICILKREMGSHVVMVFCLGFV